MSLRIARLQHANRYASLPFLYPCNPFQTIHARRAMMSALRSPPGAEPPTNATNTTSKHASSSPGPSTTNATPLSQTSPSNNGSDTIASRNSDNGGSPLSSSIPTPAQLSHDAAAPQTAAPPPPAPKVEKPRPKITSKKAVLTITPEAVTRLHNLVRGPTPQLIRIGVKNKGCAGLSYHLDYVEKPGRFDEIVEQDGVKVLVDSRALFSVIGSEMDWTEDPLSAKFTFKNPNIKDACGCGESFTVGSQKM